MCFAPWVSMSTFIIEFGLALYFLLRNPKDKLNRFIALMSFMLGFYQLNEFLICVSGANTFTRSALATTAVLPAMACTYALIMWRKPIRFWNFLLYAPAAAFIVLFSLPVNLRESATCTQVFIQYNNIGLLFRFFELYYLVYILGAVAIFYFTASRARSEPERRLHYLGMLGMFIFTVPTFIFLIFLPALRVQFASVLCEFALLLAIEFILVLWYKERHKIKF